MANPIYDYDNFWEEHASSERDVVGDVLTQPFGHECLLYENGDVKVNPTCRAAEDADFAEQFLGQWTFQMGKVLPFIAEPGIAAHCHVVDAPPRWMRDARWFWSFDYGYDHPTVGLLWAVGPGGELCIWDSFYESRLSDPEIAERIREREEKIASQFAAKVERYSGDPKRPEVKKLLERELGVSVCEMDKAAQSDRAAGHRALVNALKPHPATGIPQLVVYGPNCPQVVEEWDSLCVKEGKFSNEWGTTSLDGADHAFDAAKYGIFVARYMKPRERRHDWRAELDRLNREAWKKRRREDMRSRSLTGAAPMAVAG